MNRPTCAHTMPMSVYSNREIYAGAARCRAREISESLCRHSNIIYSIHVWCIRNLQCSCNLVTDTNMMRLCAVLHLVWMFCCIAVYGCSGKEAIELNMLHQLSSVRRAFHFVLTYENNVLLFQK